VLSGRGPCDGLISRPEESCRMCVCVCVCLGVIVKPGQCGGPGPLVICTAMGGRERERKKKTTPWPSNASVTGCEEVWVIFFFSGKDQTST